MATLIKRPMVRGKLAGALLALGASWSPVLASAQAQPAPPIEPGGETPDVYVDESGSIVVTVRPPRGAVIGNVPPELILDVDDMRATGARDIGELVDLLRPQLGGAPNEEPIVLLNGRRIANLRAISIYPREAIERTEILPPQVALSYGYPAGSRVMNIVLRESYRGGNGEAGASFATEGGRNGQEATFTFVKIAGENGLTFRGLIAREDSLLESERGIVQLAPASPFDLIGNVTGTASQLEIDPALSAIVGRPILIAGVPLSALNGVPTLADFAALAETPSLTDIGRFRSLLPSTRRIELSAQLNRLIGSVALNLTARYARSESDSQLGLATARLSVPADSPFSPFENDVLLYRYLEPGRPLGRHSANDVAQLGIRLFGNVAGWSWNYLANLDHSRSVARTDIGVDLLAVGERIAAGDPTLNPFGALEGDVVQDVSRVASTRLNQVLIVNGSPLTLPAGPARASVTSDFDMRFTERESDRSGLVASAQTSRRSFNGRALLNVPITSRRHDVAGFLGEFSLIFNAALQTQTTSRTLLSLGYGANWEPIEGVRFNAIVTEAEQRLNEEQLNEPVVETPNVRVFDFRSGETVEVVQITGGNPALLAPQARNLRLSMSAILTRRPFLGFEAGYISLRVRNPPGLLTIPVPELEDAFPDRYVRDVTGRLIRFDSRPTNFARSERSEANASLSFSLPLGTRAGAQPPGPRRASPPSAAGPTLPPGSRLIGTIGVRYGIRDEIVIRDGIAPIDLFESAYGGRTGRSRLSFNSLLAVSHDGWQARVQAVWSSGHAVRSAESALSFSALAIINAQVSLDLGARPALVRRNPLFDGLSIRLDISNLLDNRQRVRDENGETPLSYQPAYLDPLGRSIRFSLRKAF